MHTVLPGEPQHALLVEGRRVQIYVGKFAGQREQFYGMSLRIDARNRVLAAFGDPRRAVRPDDDAVGRGAGAERVFGRGLAELVRGVRGRRGVLAGLCEGGGGRG